MKYLPYIFPKKRGAPGKGTSFLILCFFIKLKLATTGRTFFFIQTPFFHSLIISSGNGFFLPESPDNKSEPRCPDLLCAYPLRWSDGFHRYYNNRFPLSHYSRKYTMWSHTFHQQLHSIPAADPLNREYGKTGWHFPTKFRPAIPSPFSLIAS